MRAAVRQRQRIGCVPMTQWLTAQEIAQSVINGTRSAEIVTADALERIAAHNGYLNAFLAVSGTALDEAIVVGRSPAKRLAGVPIAIKDLVDTAGLKTTYGSAIFAENVPADDDLVVGRLKAAGAIIVGKTMTPEFGFGAICANALQGATCNPWAVELTSGGSSGGAAAAVAAGLVPLAHGTDFGGSVRTPASFCGVLALRPTPGLIPSPKRALAFDTLATHGVLARTVDDLQLFLDAVAGPDVRDPSSLRVPYVAARKGTKDRLRIATTEDFGVAPVHSAVRRAMRDACAAIPSALGAVSWAHPDCCGAIAAFHTLRQSIIRHTFGPLLAAHADALSPTVRWAIAQGDGISAADYLRAEAQRSTLYRRFVSLFETYDVLLAPAASVLPWSNTMTDVTEIDGVALPTVIDYLAVTFIVSLAGCPVVTLPAWSAGALPFGIQLIGAPGSDATLLDMARRFERECGFSFRKPPAFH